MRLLSGKPSEKLLEIGESKAEAKYHDGGIELTLSKTPGAAGEQLEVR